MSRAQLTDDCARMVVVEEWAGPRALAEHCSTAHFRHVKEVLEGVLAEPMTIREPVAAPVG